MKHGHCVRGIVFAVLFWTVSQRPFVMRKDRNGARKQKHSQPNVALNRRVFVSQKIVLTPLDMSAVQKIDICLAVS